MNRRALIRIACCVLVAVLACGQKKILCLRDGRRITGIVTKTDTGWQVKTEVGTFPFTDQEVLGVEELLVPREQYKQRLEKIDPADAEARYELARWASENDLLAEARDQLTEALRLKPGTEKYSWLLRQVDARLRIKEAEKAETRPAEPGTPAVVKPEWLLDDEDIRRIRLEELRPRDVVSVEFRNKVLDRFIDMMYGRGEFKQESFVDRFRAMPPMQQVFYILDNIDRDNAAIKDDILIKTDPRFMVDFRARIWPAIVGSCAATTCHGGGADAKGGLKLFNVAGLGPRAEYTNFAILAGYTSGGQRVINRDLVDESLLLQYALPPEQAKFRHPVEIRSIFESRTVGGYRTMSQWIQALSGPPYPNYRLKWKPPFGMQLDLTGRPAWRITDTAPAATAPPGSAAGSK